MDQEQITDKVQCLDKKIAVMTSELASTKVKLDNTQASHVALERDFQTWINDANASRNQVIGALAVIKYTTPILSGGLAALISYAAQHWPK